MPIRSRKKNFRLCVGIWANNVLPTIFVEEFYAQLDVMPTYQNFVNDNGQKVDDFQIFNSYRVGYHIKLFKDRFFFQPSICMTHRAYHTTLPNGFKTIGWSMVKICVSGNQDSILGIISSSKSMIKKKILNSALYYLWSWSTVPVRSNPFINPYNGLKIFDRQPEIWSVGRFCWGTWNHQNNNSIRIQLPVLVIKTPNKNQKNLFLVGWRTWGAISSHETKSICVPLPMRWKITILYVWAIAVWMVPSSWKQKISPKAFKGLDNKMLTTKSRFVISGRRLKIIKQN